MSEEKNQPEVAGSPAPAEDLPVATAPGAITVEALGEAGHKLGRAHKPAKAALPPRR